MKSDFDIEKIKPDASEKIIKRVKNEIGQTIQGEKLRKYSRFTLTTLSGTIPLVGGFLSAISALDAENEQGQMNEYLKRWLEEHENKIDELVKTLPYRKQLDIISEELASSLPPGAWTHLKEISKIYDKQVKAISLLTDIKEYEPATDLYWKILYYTGYRELWKERADLSERILRLSVQTKDYKTTGLILSKGMAYALMSQKNYSAAKYVLNKAYLYFRKAKGL